jgi:hypothetical protein
MDGEQCEEFSIKSLFVENLNSASSVVINKSQILILDEPQFGR